MCSPKYPFILPTLLRKCIQYSSHMHKPLITAGWWATAAGSFNSRDFPLTHFPRALQSSPFSSLSLHRLTISPGHIIRSSNGARFACWSMGKTSNWAWSYISLCYRRSFAPQTVLMGRRVRRHLSVSLSVCLSFDLRPEHEHAWERSSVANTSLQPHTSTYIYISPVTGT